MSPVTHLLLGWLVAESAPLVRRERAVVAIAILAPYPDRLLDSAVGMGRSDQGPW